MIRKVAMGGLTVSLMCLVGGPVPRATEAFSNGAPSLQATSQAGMHISNNESVDEAPEPEAPILRANRKAKNARYNGQPSMTDLTKLPEGSGVSIIGCGMYDPTIFPTGSHDVVVLGTITSAQPYLSEDGTAIYTEYSLEVEEVLKPSLNRLSLAQGRLIVDRPGGVLRRRNGQVIAMHVSGTGVARPLDVGRRYLLMCWLTHDGRDISLGKAFELLDGKAYVLWEQRGRERLVGELPGAVPSLSEEQGFLKMARAAAKHPFNAKYFSAPRN